MQYVLQMEIVVKRNVEGYPALPVEHSPFDLEAAVNQFKVFVGDENLLEAKLVRPLFPSILLLCCISFIVI
jgi:hypothetical protein